MVHRHIADSNSNSKLPLGKGGVSVTLHLNTITGMGEFFFWILQIVCITYNIGTVVLIKLNK